MSKIIKINECSVEELERLPQVGPKTAQKIIAARPIGDAQALEELLPPSAWLSAEETGIQFDLGVTEAEPSPVAIAEKAPISAPVPELPIQLFELKPTILRRVRANDPFPKPGARYFCIWNVHWGPAGEAAIPADKSVQAEIEAWFNAHDMGITFIHYGRSKAIPTRNRGYVPLLLFEIIEETEEAKNAGENDGTSQGN